MSYPQVLADSSPQDDYVTFSIPNYFVLRKIARHSEQEENLRVKAAGNVLLENMDEISLLLSKFHLDTAPVKGRNELRVRLSVPSLPPRDPLPPLPNESPNTHQIKYVIREPSKELETSPSRGPSRYYHVPGFRSELRITTREDKKARKARRKKLFLWA
ncbi:hypothetical protein BS50DRAFT_656775 [Corynespora cassiicola Philippines]|uniref:Uncharacterized protein n=1 Tax=Corynespora cassiicola Philippines TaxID=1448308 RepID=A0A2T2N2F8_CORCC|nr:hypothetical protein BS50DRAFT_656775 [Corynespora cassiicola Philippines]